MEQVGEVRGDDVYAILNTAAKAYQYVICDCGTYYDEGVAMALTAADHVVLLTSPDVTSVRDSFRRLKMLQAVGIDKERVRLVVNKWNRATSFVSLDDIAENLGIPVAKTIAADTRSVDQALNEGKMLREVNRKSDVARDLAGLVGMLTDDDEVSDPDDEPSTGLAGFFRKIMG